MSGNNPVAPLGSPPASDSDFKIHSSRPAVRFLSRGVQPPSSVYVDTSDVLQVNCATSQNNEVVTISYRVLRADGELIKGQFQLFPPASRAVVTKQENLPEGFLLSVSCKAAVGNSRGQTFVRVFLTDPTLGSGFPSYMLMGDYVTTAMAPAHPNGRVLAPSEGPGNIQIVLGNPQGVGAEFFIAQPVNTRWRLISGVVPFTTSAVVANRGIAIAIGVLSTVASLTSANQVVPANFAGFVTWGAREAAGVGNPTVVSVPTPHDILMRIVGAVNSSTLNLQAGDQYGVPQILVEEWLDNV